MLEFFGLTKIDRQAPKKGDEDTRPVIVAASNLTIINYILVHCGPMHERTLCLAVGAVQVSASILAFAIRYGVGSLVYGGDRR